MLADSFQGKPFNRPNDLIVDRGGGIYFTDPGPGPAQRQPGVARARRHRRSRLFTTLSPQGELRQLATDITRSERRRTESRREDAVRRRTPMVNTCWRTTSASGRLGLEAA